MSCTNFLKKLPKKCMKYKQGSEEEGEMGKEGHSLCLNWLSLLFSECP